MSQSVYSLWGSPLQLLLSDEFVSLYNQAVAEWFTAQSDHEARTGHEWDPLNEPILINWTKDQRKAFDDMARLMNLMIEINGGYLDIPEEQMTSDFLVKL